MSDSAARASGRAGEGRGDLRAGVLGAPASRADDRTARPPRCVSSPSERGLLVPEDLVFEDEGFSGAMLAAARRWSGCATGAFEGRFEVLLCHAPDRLARRYAYQVLLLEEFARGGIEVVLRQGARAVRHARG